MLTAITNARIFSGQSVIENKTILVQNGKILSIETNFENSQKFAKSQDVKIIDLKGQNIAPGFIDIQINGGKNIYFSEHPNIQTLDDIYETCCEYATPFILPTVITSNLETILQAIKAVRSYRQKHPGVLGMHLQGPFLNPKKAGAHKKNLIRKPTNEELNKIVQQGKDVIKVMTIAPECFTQEQLDMLLQSGIVLSIGHSDINYEEAQKYFKKGIHLATHLYNAMNQMGHRECGLVGAIFDNQNVYASIILDGGHCHYAAARIAYKLKKDKLILVTDSSFLGRYKQSHSWENWNFKMVEGFFRDSNGNLSGAAISMPQAFKNAVENIGIGLQQAVQMCTSQVAKAIKIQKQIGFIKQGYPGTFSVFDNQMKKYKTLIV